MAILSDEQRRDIWADWMRVNDEPIAIVKADLRAAVDAIDNWVNSNVSSFNTAIPQPARNSLTARQKAWLLARVVEARFKVGA